MRNFVRTYGFLFACIPTSALATVSISSALTASFIHGIGKAVSVEGHGESFVW